MMDDTEAGARRLHGRWKAVLAGLVAAVGLAFALVYFLFHYFLRLPGPLISETLSFGVFFPLASAVIIYRQPRNPVGWLILVIGMGSALPDLLGYYATTALVRDPGRYPLGDIAIWLGMWMWLFSSASTVMLLALFPNGQPLSPRWRLVNVLAVLITLPVVVYVMVSLWPFRGLPLLAFYNGDASQLGETAQRGNTVLWIWQIGYLLLELTAAASFVLRFVRARGVERQQIKWVLYALTLVPFTTGLPLFRPFQPGGALYGIYQAINLLAISGFPLALTISITRYRLYEIDVIIRKTLVYALLTGALALIYFGCVMVLQTLFSLLLHEQSPLTIVVSTLLIAGLFRPMHARIQGWIDRRFYRRRYNAEQALERFSARMRGELDLEQFDQQVLQVVGETIQPETVSLVIFKR